MFINTLDIPGYSRLHQILHTLKHVHQFEFDSHDGDQLQETQQHYLHVQQQIVETSTFNTYHTNPEYAKAALITEAIKMLLEIAPKRRKKAAVQETKKKQPKPDFLDVDKDGNKKELFKKAVADKAKADNLDEKWGKEMKPAAKDMDKWEGYTIAELKARKKKLMDKEERTGAFYKEVRQINFAIRAKQGNSLGKVKESMLMEDENLDKAETLLAAKDLSDRLQNMAEDAAKMAVDRLMPLVDVMKSQFGQEPADAFNQIVKSHLQTVLDTIISAKDQTDNAILTLQGGGVPSMGSDISQPVPGAEAPAAEPQVGGEEEFQAGPATAGPAEEPLGRSMKEPMRETLRAGGPFKRKMEESAKPEDIITDANDRRRYIALRKQEEDHLAQAGKPKDTKQAHHKKMAQQHNDQANDILDKYRSSVEEAQQPNATQTIQDMATKGKDATGKPLSPTQKMAAKKAADELVKANLEEKLTKKMAAGEIISDFVNSDNPKFKGKSKAERTRMALGAYYGMHPEKSKKQESYNNVKAVVESLTTEFNNLKMKFQQHKKIFQESVRHGATFDILNEGYGLEGAAILEQMKQIKTHLDTHRETLKQLRTEIQEQFALDQTIVTKVQKLSEQAQTLPYGIVGVLSNKQKFRKFFINESQRTTWIEYNQEYIKESTLVDPQDLDRVRNRLKNNI